ncbi:TonB-dependent siderophore receptor [Pseudomonas plecoglossicida]|uniref:TonB-dependent siderophore receptor n=1 Tax=Pseudomonas TaxID=286 RepID=UPI000760E794|nr:MULTISPECIES: TonB-dependent siderophore receptor [Pseudomonas]MCE1061641.1 TonB-dependent siderophore receptor [Pseudomonas alloputida]MDQ7967775.1 TonB-dependent siderophore receptor [Pseudomonas plecoglossicida]WBM48408.1 TonB-dependent siderophore receptor [Pseudomonas putida]WFG04867.1 TonB-dependent siderophore receptor [Pseudomonas putida]
MPAGFFEFKPLVKALCMSRSISARSSRALFGKGVLGAALMLPMAAQVWAQGVNFDIAAQSLPNALRALGEQADVQFIYNASEMADLRGNEVRGSYTVDAAVAKLLRGLPVSYSLEGDTLTLVRRERPASSALELGTTSITGNTLGVTTEGSNSYTTGGVTIGKSEHKLKDIPQSVSVMTRKRMDDQNITDLPTLLANAPGMTFAKSPGTGGFITSRGFEIDSLQYDGVPMTRGIYALGSYLTEPTAFYDRVELLRGGAALLQGANSPGGAINFVRKRGQAKPTVTLTAQAGSWDHYATQVDVGGPLNEAGNIRGRAVVDYDTRNSFIDYVGGWEQKVYGALDFDLSEDTTLGVGISDRKTRFTPMVAGLPRFSDGRDVGLSRSTFTGSDWNRGMTEQLALYVDLEHRFNDHWKFKTAAVAINERNEMTYAYVVAPTGLANDGSGLFDWRYATDFNSHSRGLDMFVDGDFNGFGFDQEVVFGGNYSRFTSDNTMAVVRSAGANIFDLDNHLPFENYDSLAARGTRTDSQYKIVQKGIYGTWRVKLTDPLTLILGGRTSWYSYDYDSQVYQAGVHQYDSPASKANNGVVTPYAGLVYELTPQWSAYASYADVFIPQSAIGVGGSTIEPITGSNYELGLKGELNDGQVNTSVALFRYDHENRAVPILNTESLCGGSNCAAASGKVRSQGLEAEINGEVLPGLQASASYVYNTTKYLKDNTYEDKIFSTWTPKHSVKVWTDYTLPGDFSRFSVGGGFNSQSSTVAYDRKFDSPGFTIWNARLGYKVSDEVSLAVNFNNIFDKVYYIPSYAAVSANNYYGDPRNFMFSVKYTPQF